MRNNDNYPDFLVGVRCMTYNHHAYIEDAMNGFTMQQTTFPFVCAIIDDASTDGEPDVILRYMNDHFDLSPESGARQWETDEARFLYARHRQNPNCYFGIVLLKTNYYSQHKSKGHLTTQWLSDVKYYALCEGDDYWTDPKKLQLQVDFLEAHSDYCMCFHRAIEHWEDGLKEDAFFSEIDNREYSGIELFENWIVPTASVVLKSSVFNSYIYQEAIRNKKFIYGDIILFLSCCACGKVYGMSNVMCVYRRHEGSAVFDYSVERQIKQAYHSLEIYKVFGIQYIEISKEKFFNYGMMAFLNAKAEGNIKYKLLFDLLRYTLGKTITFFVKKVK